MGVRHIVGKQYLVDIKVPVLPTDHELNGKLVTLTKIVTGLEFNHICLVEGRFSETAFKGDELVPYEELDESEIWE